jgi:hypothetical protein
MHKSVPALIDGDHSARRVDRNACARRKPRSVASAHDKVPGVYESRRPVDRPAAGLRIGASLANSATAIRTASVRHAAAGSAAQAAPAYPLVDNRLVDDQGYVPAIRGALGPHAWVIRTTTRCSLGSPQNNVPA